MFAYKLKSNRGFSLVELTIIIVVIAVAVSLAMQSMTALVQDARKVKTQREMEMLAKAILGDPSIKNGGTRSDFGYIGNVGAFPPNLEALVQNPGGYATWDGPYIPSGFTEDTDGFKTDEWGKLYNYTGGITITSTGSGSTITKKIADATSDYLLNTFNGFIKDSSDSLPGATYKDSVDIEVTIPDGSGSTVTKTYNPDSTGVFTLDSLPVGIHSLDIVYVPNVDTLHRYLTILPRHKSGRTYKFASSYFSSGGGAGLTVVSASDSIAGPGCREIIFWIENNSGSDIDISNITLTWSSPVAYYEGVNVDGTGVFNETNPRSGSGDLSVFSTTKTIVNGTSVRVKIERWKDVPTGAGANDVNMSGTTFTVLFSDGSTFAITVGTCP